MALNKTISQNTTSPPNAYIEEPRFLATVRIIVFSLVIFFGLLGNTAVIRAIRSGRSRKPLTHYLVTSLAVAELFNSVFLVFHFVYVELWHWVFGSFLCHVIYPFMVLTFGVSTNTLACISIFRYVVIVAPHKKPPSKRVCLGIVAGAWLISFVVALPLFFMYVLEETLPGYYDCHVTQVDLDIYDMVRISLLFFLPVLIMIVVYAVATARIKEHMTFMESRQNRLNSNVSTLNTYLESQVNGDSNINLLTVPPHQYKQVVYIPNGHSPHGSVCHINRVPENKPVDASRKRKSSSRDEGSMIESERDIIKMFYVIVIVFLVCYIPYQVYFLCSILKVLDESILPYSDLLNKYTILLTSFPSALHPLCYGTMSRFYARAFSRFILCKRKK